MNPEKQSICRLKQDGLTYSQIGSMFGFSRQRAQQIVSNQRRSAPIDRCSRCGRNDIRIDEHHVSYVPEVKILLCVKCHRVEEFASAFENLANAVRSKFNGLSVVHAVDFFEAFQVSKDTFQKLRKALGLKLIYKGVPWHRVNWSLPTSDLAAVWKVSHNNVNVMRMKYRKFMTIPKPPLYHKPCHDEALAAEKKIADKFFVLAFPSNL